MTHRQRIELKFLVNPRSKQSTRFTTKGGKMGNQILAFTPKDLKKYQDNLTIEALAQRPRGFKKFTGPILAVVTYKFVPEKNLKASLKDQIRSGKRVFKITDPDITDNLNKPLFDALQGHFYTNDNQIVRVTAQKIYSTKSGIELSLIEI